MGEYHECLLFALGAGDLFDLSAKTEFVETVIGSPFTTVCLIVAKCVEKYIKMQINAHEGPVTTLKDGDQEMYQYDERLEVVVERMFEKCIENRDFEQVAFCLFPPQLTHLGPRCSD